LSEQLTPLVHFALPFGSTPAYFAPVLRSRLLFPASFVIISSLVGALPASAEVKPLVQREVVNRIVAVVDQDVITLVELKRRAEPFQSRLAGVPADKRAAAEAQLNRDLINEAIDERLIARDARVLFVSITTAEVDTTLDAIAKAKSVTREKLLALAVEQGFSEAQYREQLVRQLLIARLIRIRMAEQLKNLDKDLDKASKQIEKVEKQYLSGLRANVFIEVRL
jgi:parvulin-like peptidyl-prolyl isomerase